MPRTRSVSFAAQKFRAAVHAMALSDAPLRHRLSLAFLAIQDVTAKDLLHTQRAAFREVVAGLTWAPATFAESKLAAAIRHLDDNGVARLSTWIALMNTQLDRTVFEEALERGRLESKQRGRPRRVG